MTALQLGSSGPDVVKLQQTLKQHGFDPGNIDGEFGRGTEAAVLAFQKSERLFSDGVAGPRTLAALGLAEPAAVASAVPGVTITVVSEMFPHTPIGNIKANLPPVLHSLVDNKLTDKPMVLVALATIRAETESFEPIGEGRSRYNTSPNGHPFDLYDYRKDLGNQGPPDGEHFRGRGYVQLTGRFNYAKFGAAIGLGDRLLSNPDLASDPETAAQLLSAFLKDKQQPIQEALLEGDLKTARRLVNGGTNGLDRFSEAYTTGQGLIA